MKRRASRNIGLKAFLDTDADLVRWWEEMPDGERSEALRRIIRSAISGNTPQQVQPASDQHLGQVREDTAWIRQTLTDLPAYLERLMGHVAIAAKPDAAQDANEDTDAPRLLPEDLERRRAKIQKSRW